MKSLKFATENPPPPATLPVNVAGFLQNFGAAAVCHPVAEGALLAAFCAFLEKVADFFPKKRVLVG